MDFKYDIIVVGAGHAGCEAAVAAAKLGSKVVLITMDMNKIAQMSCNPAMGGIAKGQIVREIDALGGMAGIVADETAIQFRMLNRSKGPAMWSPRVQSDRFRFIEKWRSIVENTENLDMWQDTVNQLIIEDGHVKGVRTNLQVEFFAKAVVLTNGTFLNGLMHIGKVQMKGGRISEPASLHISDQLEQAGFVTGRMKTGTPVRIDGRTIDFNQLIEQEGEEDFHKFSYLNFTPRKLKTRSCYIARTNADVHKVLEGGLDESPMYDGTIESTGPRYCPSIETKIVTFADKTSHQLFAEPEGETTQEYYLNGFSSSLPLKVQLNALKKVPGFENVKIYRPGYAIEYDYFDPTQLEHTLETKLMPNLYFAGQINGTTGYEEAGAQGLLAGINAHQKVAGKAPFILNRNQAYMGVLIDDLVTKGVDEPYRMFTSRAEFRILLRQDDADVRLTPLGYELGLAEKDRMVLLEEKIIWRDKIIDFVKGYSVKQNTLNDFLQKVGTNPLKQGVKLLDVLLRPQVSLAGLINEIPALKSLVDDIPNRREEILEAAEILMKYEGYISREKIIADKLTRLENVKIKDKFVYEKINGLSTEARQKLAKINPNTIGQAQRISGVSPADINVLLVLMGR